MTALTQHAPVLEIYQDIANLTSRMLAAVMPAIGTWS